VQHVVGRPVSHPLPPSQTGYYVRHIGARFGSARYDNLLLSGGDAQGSQLYGAQARGAADIHGKRRAADRKTTSYRTEPRRVRADPGLPSVAENNLPHRFGSQARPPQRFFDNRCAEVHRREIFKAAPETAARRSDGACYHHFVHEPSPSIA
jgi:hypothetical protein